MITPTHKFRNKDGTFQLVRVIGYEPNYWHGVVEKAVNRNKEILKDYHKHLCEKTGQRITKFEKICNLAQEYIYKSQPIEEKMFFVEPIDNIPFNTSKCFYTKYKFLEKIK